MVIKEDTSSMQLARDITELVVQLQGRQKQRGKYKRFQMQLERTLVEHGAYENNLLVDLIVWLEHSQGHVHASPYRDYTIASLRARLVHDVAGTRTDNEPVGETAHEDLIPDTVKAPGFVELNSELADADQFVKRIKRIRVLRPCVEFLDNIESHKAKINSLVRRVWSVIRKLLLFGLLDRLYLWLRDNHKDRRFIVELATLLLFAGKVAMMLLWIAGYLLNPAKLFRKVLPREIDEALPTD